MTISKYQGKVLTKYKLNNKKTTFHTERLFLYILKFDYLPPEMKLTMSNNESFTKSAANSWTDLLSM